MCVCAYVLGVDRCAYLRAGGEGGREEWGRCRGVTCAHLGTGGCAWGCGPETEQESRRGTAGGWWLERTTPIN